VPGFEASAVGYGVIGEPDSDNAVEQSDKLETRGRDRFGRSDPWGIERERDYI